jgi:carbon dioxide concentrating mechanism protein CcmN
MYLPQLPLSSNYHLYVQGDVRIDPSAVISSGVILQADPDSTIIISANVCIGTGSILHADRGTLEVEVGANLGAGVLIVGQGKIGANACIGSLTTMYNSSVEPRQVIPSASLLGDTGRQIATVSSVTTNTFSVEIPKTPESSATTTKPESIQPESIQPESINEQVTSTPVVVSEDTTKPDASAEVKVKSSTSEVGISVYGQGSLDRILKTLFPYNQSLNSPPPSE